jgi:hypothetical protein
LSLGIAAFIAEIIIIFSSKTSNLANNILKPGTLYAYAFALGQFTGGALLSLSGNEKKL